MVAPTPTPTGVGETAVQHSDKEKKHKEHKHKKEKKEKKEKKDKKDKRDKEEGGSVKSDKVNLQSAALEALGLLQLSFLDA